MMPTCSRRDFLQASLAATMASPLVALAEQPPDGRGWFGEKRFGLFIHWGIYSVAGWHEQHMYRKKLSRAEYAPLQQQFNPTKFNPDVVLTRRGNTLYVHLIKEPETASIFLTPLTASPRRATLLNTGETVDHDVADLPRLHNQTPDRCLRLKHLPVNTRPTAGWVVKLEFENPPSANVSGRQTVETK